MENLDKHYLALGLQRGATQEEIRSAFRQMVKQYHPDQDSSTYAQMRYHEARQAYSVLSNTAGAKSKESPNPTTETQQTVRDNNFTGANTGQGVYGNGGFAREREEKFQLQSISLHDYFFQWQLILAVIGSMVIIFVAQRYVTPFIFTEESSVRLFIHTAVFVFVSWLIVWCIRFTRPPHVLHDDLTVVVFILGIIYAIRIYGFTLPQEAAEVRSRSVDNLNPVNITIHILFIAGKFIFVFYLALCSLEKGGIRAGLSNAVRFVKRAVT